MNQKTNCQTFIPQSARNTPIIFTNKVMRAENFAKKLDISTHYPKKFIFLTILLPSHWNLTTNSIPYLNTL